MYHFTETAIPVIAGDIAQVLDMTDQALAAQALLLSNMIAANSGSDVPFNATQRVVEEAVCAMTSLLDARSRTGKNIARLTAIGRQSKHKELMDGCPAGFPAVQADPKTEVLA